MSHPFIGCCNVIEKDGKFVLVRETKAQAYGQYNLPAGSLEPGESIVEGAIREAQEETGLVVEPQYFVGFYERKLTREKHFGLNCTVYSVIKGGNLTKSVEHPEVSLFSLDEIKDLDRRGLLRGKATLRAVLDYLDGKSLPLDVIQVIE